MTPANNNDEAPLVDTDAAETRLCFCSVCEKLLLGILICELMFLCQTQLKS